MNMSELAVKGEAAVLSTTLHLETQGCQGKGNRCPAGLINGVTILYKALRSGMAFIKKQKTQENLQLLR